MKIEAAANEEGMVKAAGAKNRIVPLRRVKEESFKADGMTIMLQRGLTDLIEHLRAKYFELKLDVLVLLECVVAPTMLEHCVW